MELLTITSNFGRFPNTYGLMVYVICYLHLFTTRTRIYNIQGTKHYWLSRHMPFEIFPSKASSSNLDPLSNKRCQKTSMLGGKPILTVILEGKQRWHPSNTFNRWYIDSRLHSLVHHAVFLLLERWLVSLHSCLQQLLWEFSSAIPDKSRVSMFFFTSAVQLPGIVFLTCLHTDWSFMAVSQLKS